MRPFRKGEEPFGKEFYEVAHYLTRKGKIACKGIEDTAGTIVTKNINKVTCDDCIEHIRLHWRRKFHYPHPDNPNYTMCGEYVTKPMRRKMTTNEKLVSCAVCLEQIQEYKDEGLL